MPSHAIEVRVTEPVATILLNRPDKRNALTRSMILEIREALRDLYQEKRVRAVVLAGAGDAFCAGRDIAEMVGPEAVNAVDDGGPHDPEPQRWPEPQRCPEPQRWGDEAAEFRDLILEIIQLPKPVIASVNGPAVACGAGLVLASDLVVAGPHALFGLPEARRGVVAGVVAPLLAFRVGAGAAARLALSASLITADEAFRLGVYHEIVADDLVWARAAQVGRDCAAAAPESIALTKRLILETAGEQLETQLTSGAIATATSRTTHAAREGLAAFLDKRDPEWPR